MLSTPRAPRRVAAALLTAAVAGLAALSSLPAEAAPRTPVVTAEARAAGVQPGNATMGWRQQSPMAGRSTLPSGPSLSTSRTTGPAAAAKAKKKAFVPKGVLGIDVSSWQRDVDWDAQVASGKLFAYVKATEGTGYKNPYFRSQYTGSYYAGMVRGAYHFASPSGSSGTKQAQLLRQERRRLDRRTAGRCPGVLDIEYNPYGATCYGLSKAKMVSWIKDFTTRVQAADHPGRRHLHHDRLVDPLHREHARRSRDQPAVGGPLRHDPGHPAGRLDLGDVLAVHRHPDRPEPLQRLATPGWSCWPPTPAEPQRQLTSSSVSSALPARSAGSTVPSGSSSTVRLP